jgi:hypothetical protein
VPVRARKNASGRVVSIAVLPLLQYYWQYFFDIAKDIAILLLPSIEFGIAILLRWIFSNTKQQYILSTIRNTATHFA